MKFTVTMKDPDSLYYSVEDALKNLTIDGVTEKEMGEIRERRSEDIRNLCQKWFEYGEYLRVEIDTEAKTCTVIPHKS